MQDDFDLIDESAVQTHIMKNATPEHASEKIDVGKIRKMSIRDEIVKQSSLYIDKLSILEKSKLCSNLSSTCRGSSKVWQWTNIRSSRVPARSRTSPCKKRSLGSQLGC